MECVAWTLGVNGHTGSEVKVAPAPGRITVHLLLLRAVTVMTFCNKAVGNTAGRKRHQDACAGREGGGRQT